MSVPKRRLTHPTWQLVWTLGAFVVLLFSAARAQAHDAAPCLVTVTEAEDAVHLLWKVPEGNLDPGRLPALPMGCTRIGDGVTSHRENSDLWRARFACDALAGQTLTIPVTPICADTVVRYERDDGVHAAVTQTAYVFPATGEVAEDGAAALTFLVLGIEHILLGWDHLTFVLCLLLLAFTEAPITDRREQRKLLIAITAFTVGHSASLIAVMLGSVGLPGPPVEAAIALSIVLLAAEAVTRSAGSDHLTPSAHATGLPWWAGLFGLVHGLGFAGAISEIGLPAGQELVTLLAFNAGVEVGQVIFVIAALSIAHVATRLSGARLQRGAHRLLSYGAGLVAGFWLVERVVGFW